MSFRQALQRIDDEALLLGKPDYSLSTNDDLPAADHIATLSSIAIVFPVFSDGRGFTMRAVFSPHLALPAHCLLMAILSLIRQIICFVALYPCNGDAGSAWRLAAGAPLYSNPFSDQA